MQTYLCNLLNIYVFSTLKNYAKEESENRIEWSLATSVNKSNNELNVIDRY